MSVLRFSTAVVATTAFAFALNADPGILFIGTQGLGHVSPAAAWPFGMVQAGPDTSRFADRYVGDWPHTSGYQFDEEYLWRFSQCRFFGIGCGSMGFMGLLPSVIPFDADSAAYCKKMDKGSEMARPGYYSVRLAEDRIVCETSVLAHSAAYRFTFPNGSGAYLLVDPGWGVQGNEPVRRIDMTSPGACFGRYVMDSEARQQSPTRIALHTRQVAWNEVECWSVMEFSVPVKAARKLRAGRFPYGEIWEYEFGELPGGRLDVRLALSKNSIRAAARNLEAEMPAFAFDEVKERSRAEWQRYLSRIRLGGNVDPTDIRKFEAAYYRTLIHPSDLGDVGQPHEYSNLSLWDIFRACSPLQTLVAPEKTGEIVGSMVDIFERQGYLPLLHSWGNETHCMVGHHAVPIIADAYLKGIGGFDAERAYEAVKDSLTVSHVRVNDSTWGLLKEDWDLWNRFGYYPYDLLSGEHCGRKVKGESVSRTLECAYDDACAARFATAIGKREDARFFGVRSGNWTNVFDATTGFMRGKDSRGNWREPFDPKACGAGPWADNDFTEGNAWQYTWHVMHDVPGLVKAMGGENAFGRKLEALFGEGAEIYGPSFTHDVSGLIGQYAHGNEPSHHVAYLFRFSDVPQRTDEFVRRICQEMYRPDAEGLSGNDDAGQMAAWYVFSALGFYPLDACGGEYVIGAPQVPQATLCLPNGKEFRIVAMNLSATNKFVKSVTLNGNAVRDWKIRHQDILKGGELVFEMADKVICCQDKERK